MARKTPEPLQVRHGTTAQAEATVGAPAELGADLQKKHIILYDGEKAGGYPAARADRKVSSATEGLTVNGGETATLADDIELKDSRRWLKRVDEIPEDTTELLADVPVGGAVVTPDAEPQLFPYEYPGPYNDEIWITESDTFIAPVTGEYEVFLINGGNGGYISQYAGNGGHSGAYRSYLKRLIAGQQVPVVIGAGGVGNAGGSQTPVYGGYTYFDGETTTAENFIMGSRVDNATALANYIFPGSGGGFGGGQGEGVNLNGHWYGAGGGIRLQTGANIAGNGMQGAIRLRFFNPNKPH